MSSDRDEKRLALPQLPHIEIEIGPVTVPFGDKVYAIDEGDFLNYLRMVYGVWEPQDQPVLALKIAPIADFMQSRYVRELCDLMASQSPISWSNQLCYSAFDFARRWSLSHLALAISSWIDANIAVDAVLARLLSSTADHFLALLPMLKLDPVVQVQALVRYAARQPLRSDLCGRLRVEDDMVDVLCRGYRSLYCRWTRTSTTREVLRLTRAMQFADATGGLRVTFCLLDLIKDQLLAGPLVYMDELSLP